MMKSLKIIAIFILLICLLSPFVSASYIGGQDIIGNVSNEVVNPNSRIDSKTASILEQLEKDISYGNEKSMGEVRIVLAIGMLLGFILIPISILVGILYLVKSKSSTVKKVTLGIIIFASPFILIFLLQIVRIIVYA